MVKEDKESNIENELWSKRAVVVVSIRQGRYN